MFQNFQFSTIVTSEPLSRNSVVQSFATSWAADPPRPPFVEANSSMLLECKTMENKACRAISTRQNCLVSHTRAVACLVSLVSDVFWRAIAGNSQYSQKSDFKTSFHKFACIRIKMLMSSCNDLFKIYRSIDLSAANSLLCRHSCGLLFSALSS